ncbi:MAG: hypothetical protein IJL83_06095 [Clostridia bacterium]|nr:hypothetical protein [Clostridia bacterium]
MSAFSFIPWKSGSGGHDLSEITAGEDQILAGYRSVNKFGETIYGAIYPENTEPIYVSAASYDGPEVLSVNIPANGYYYSSASGGNGLWVGWGDLARVIGLTADKLKPGVTVIGVTGR